MVYADCCSTGNGMLKCSWINFALAPHGVIDGGG
jgi:hypothetical protein